MNLVKSYVRDYKNYTDFFWGKVRYKNIFGTLSGSRRSYQMKFRMLFGAVLIAALQGCASFQKKENKPYIIYKEIKIEITSDPLGSEIEVDNNYIGKTPCTAIIKRQYHWEFTLRRYFPDDRYVEVVANPVFEGGYVQRKSINTSNESLNKIYFNMRLSPRDPTYNFNIH